MRGATLFSGGGGVECLLKNLIDFVHAVEYDAAIAAVYAANIGDHVTVAKVQDVDYGAWGQLDYLHASPVCKEFSNAKTGGTEGDGDITSALAVVRALEATQPKIFTLENVQGYARSQSYKLICQALTEAGYMWHADVLNAADYGVPQTRRRLILRAVKDALLPGLPAPRPWVGWYAAIEDLIPTLPSSRFAEWQLARLPEDMKDVLIDSKNTGQEYGKKHRERQEPSFTVVTDAKPSHMPRAFIMDGQPNDYGQSITLPQGDEPMYTLSASMEKRTARAFLVGATGSDACLRMAEEPALTVVSSERTMPPRAWLSQGRVVKMTPRSLARFQSFPDWYVLPEKNSLAVTIIGNAVPPLLMHEVVLPLLEVVRWTS